VFEDHVSDERCFFKDWQHCVHWLHFVWHAACGRLLIRTPGALCHVK
jgi:hypothetical protein